MPYTRVLPKPLLPIGERPVIEIIVGQLRDTGVSEIILATGYLSSLIETFLGDGSAHGVPISYMREPHRLGTAGPLALIDGLDETFLVVNGDVLTTPMHGDMIDAHRGAGACATLATAEQDVEIDFGVIELGEERGGLRSVSRIHEKPSNTVSIFMGIAAFEPAALDFLEPGEYTDVPAWVDRLVDAGKPVASYEHEGYWADVGTVHDLERACAEFERSAEAYVASGAGRRSLSVPVAGKGRQPGNGRHGSNGRPLFERRGAR